ncbi:MAG: TetR/AcrR family transcriptional regulator [Ilumatobacter sp.]|uniref:TetR/AcrR family transcriptional regulator n=1 Tax=Ilumatobacter sp. TaxID=1967498 RepID=UPI002636EF6A|nr:TetR/AcrR family transcriptional regulator [Ilumatobacter sp.]MDJ0769584.1 TetR/AcrR family transcriptional regulator [Ilumatobacter sp.]
MSSGGVGGRPRDDALDEAIIEAAVEVLTADGVDGVSFAKVAARAQTTRPALYRRYASPTELVIDAVHRVADQGRPDPSGDHLIDLEAELRAFRDGVEQARTTGLAGSMMLGSTEPTVVEAYRTAVVQPRRRRLREILDAARACGSLTAAPADLDVAVTMCTGSFYAYALAGEAPARDWPRTTARLVWRACGGDAA